MGDRPISSDYVTISEPNLELSFRDTEHLIQTHLGHPI